jgi:hypothetical protein
MLSSLLFSELRDVSILLWELIFFFQPSQDPGLSPDILDISDLHSTFFFFFCGEHMDFLERFNAFFGFIILLYCILVTYYQEAGFVR